MAGILTPDLPLDLCTRQPLLTWFRGMALKSQTPGTFPFSPSHVIYRSHVWPNSRGSCTKTLERAQSHLRELEFLEAHLAKDKLSDSFSLKIPKRNITSSIKELQKAVNSIEAIEKSSADLSADERLLQYPNHTTFGGDYLWSVAKTCAGLTGLNKSFFMHKNEEKLKSRGGMYSGIQAPPRNIRPSLLSRPSWL